MYTAKLLTQYVLVFCDFIRYKRIYLILHFKTSLTKTIRLMGEKYLINFNFALK